MKKMCKSGVGYILTLVFLVIVMSLTAIVSFAASPDIISSGGWFESAYAEWNGVSGADGYNAYIAVAGSNSWAQIDGALIRQYNGGFRVDAVGLKADEYVIKIVPTSAGNELVDKTIFTDTLKVSPFDRSGYAHFNYTEGVGAYNDDGTLKNGAIVLYVTNENKDTVSITSKDGTTVVGIGNILNSVGQDVGGGKNSKGGIANSNKDIIRKLANDGTPLVVRIIGNVTAPAGLTAYDSVDYGGSTGDNGFMARMSGGKDITIEGIGPDATINGWGLHFICQSADYSNGIGKSFEVRNISFKNVPEDCVGMEGQQDGSTLTAPVERCWIHHCNFYAPVISNPAESDKDGGDGACDFKRGQYFTNSYCYYDGYHKTNLVGSGDDSLQYHLTYHHNYWKNCESRGPLARQANIHMYNNIFECQTSYCMSLRANSYIFSEYNMFIKCKNVVDDKTGGVCKSYNNSFASSSFGSGNINIVDNKSDTVSSGNKYANFDTNSSLSYIPSGDYLLQESIAEMKAFVLAYSGTQRVKNVTPDDINASVIPSDRYPTAAVILDYSKSLNNSTVPAVSGTFDNIVFNVKKVASDGITVGGTANDCDIVFFVDTEVNISMTAVAGTYLPVLCNEYGEEIITGTGSANNLPSGFYFIQSGGYDVGSAKYKEAKISALSITAVDPNAAPNPVVPTPPPAGGGDGPDIGDNGNGENGDGNGSGDNNENQGGTTLPAGSYTHNFTENGKTDPTGFFTISGNLSSSKGSVSYNGLTLTQCLKIESSTSISFTAPEKGTLVLVFGGSTSAAGKQIKLDGELVDIASDNIATVSVSAGAHSISKDDSINLFYIAYYSESQQDHVHSYVTYRLDPTCTESGCIYTSCECGDEYSQVVDPLGHSFTDGICSVCGEKDPDYIPDNPHEHIFVDGKCECGESDPDYTPEVPHVHEFIDGKCECGESDPDYTPVEPEEKPENNPGDGDTLDTPIEDNKPEEKPEELNIFVRIWLAIINFFKTLFGIK